MKMSENEVIHLMLLRILPGELIQRFLLPLELIMLVMGQAAVLRPDVSYAVGDPRVKRAEEPLHNAVVEYVFDDTIAERRRSEAVSMSEAKPPAGYIHDTRLGQLLHAELFKI